MHNKNIGKIGEDLAADFLEQKGYDIVERNCQNRYGEIDLVCKNDEDMIFVEVKTRIGEQFGLPEDAVNKNKIEKIMKNAQAYMRFKTKNVYIYMYRIDAICIVLDKNMNLQRINHYENITM